MPSSTSSSDFDRALPVGSLGRSGVYALLLAAMLMIAWEFFWRSEGAEPSYRNSESLWTIQRRRIDNGQGNRVVFAGSSRVLFDLQLDIWEQESGKRPIQLALEGTSPVRVMEGLAEDTDFTGSLIVGVAPGLFFSGFEYRKAVLDRYGKESPTQWLGQQVSMLIEPYLAFYSFDFSLFTVIKRQAWPGRDGVVSKMDIRKLANMEADRNNRMWSKVDTDPSYRAIARQGWVDGFKPLSERSEEQIARMLEGRAKQIERAVAATKKLNARGVEVIFLRNPSEGHYAISEPMFNPRDKTWDVLIEQTGVLGVHWQDHVELQGFWLPEWSHMTGSEADRYTKALYHLIERERAATGVAP
jgi:hypothetical protein